MAKNKKVKKRFLAVDVWQSEFGPISVKAVYDVFISTFHINPSNLKNYSFTHCLEALRKNEDPERYAELKLKAARSHVK